MQGHVWISPTHHWLVHWWSFQTGKDDISYRHLQLKKSVRKKGNDFFSLRLASKQKNIYFVRVVVWCGVNWKIIHFLKHPFRQESIFLLIHLFKSSWRWICSAPNSSNDLCLLLWIILLLCLQISSRDGDITTSQPSTGQTTVQSTISLNLDINRLFQHSCD